MAGYVIAQIKVNDPEPYKNYVKQNTELVGKFGGKFLVRGGDVEVLEGEFPPTRTIVLEFPSVEAARTWYDSPEYAGPKSIRKATADTNLMIVDGA